MAVKMPSDPVFETELAQDIAKKEILSCHETPLSLATDVTDMTLGASSLWLGTPTGTSGTAILTKSFLGRSPWFQGQQILKL